MQKGIEAKSAYRHRLNRRSKIGHRCIGRPMYQRRCQAPRRSFFSTGLTDGASVHTTGVMTSASRGRFLQHRLNRRSKKRASVHWPSFVPETMSSAQKKCLQHRFNQWGIGAYHRCNDVSAQEKFLQHRFNRWVIGAYHRCNDVSVQEKIPSAPVEPVKHRWKASVQPVVTALALRNSTATSVYE